MVATPRSRVVNWRRSISLALLLAISVGLGVGYAQNPAYQKKSGPHPSIKIDGDRPSKASDTRIVRQRIEDPFAGNGSVVVRQASSASVSVVVPIDSYSSWDGISDSSNDVAVIDVAALGGFGSGSPVVMTGVSWDLTIDTTSAPAPGSSYLSEARMYFDDNVAPDLSGLFLAPGILDTFAGVASYNSGGVVDLTDNDIPNIYLPDGLLRIEFYEGYDDVADAIDATYPAVSTVTIEVADGTIGACCEDATGTCVGTQNQATCEGTAGQTWNLGEDCATFACPAPAGPGDDCTNPIVVDFATDLPYSDTGQTTCGRGDSSADTCMDLYDGGEDIIYELVVPSDMCVNIVMTSDTTYTGMGVDVACPLGIPCEAEVGTSSTDESLLVLNLTAGTHYLMLDTWPSPDCINSFDLSIEQCPTGGACCHEDGTCDDVAGAGSCAATGDSYGGDGSSCATYTCPPPNDLCDNATKITTVPFADNGVDMTGATDDANVDPSCDSSFSCDTGPANNGVWYTYTPTESCTATIDQTGIDAATSIWTGVDCNSLTQETCSDPDPFDFEMAAGVEYWILVSNWSCSSEPSSTIDFTLDCVPLPKGACCQQGAGVCNCTEVAGVDCAGTYKGDNTSCSDDPDPCDCNGNGTCDEGDLVPGAAEDYSASGLALAIPDVDTGGLSHVINVPSGGTIADLNVSLDISHTWVGDLCVSLTHPNGTTTVQLIQRPGDGALLCDAMGCCGCGSDDYDITLDDEGGGGAIEDLCGDPMVSPPSYTPNGALSAFDGLDKAGDWTLTVNDNYSGDTGMLNGWTLSFNAMPATSEDCNGNGTPDECEPDCDGNGVPDSCDVNPSDPDGDSMVAPDCNGNGQPDVCDVPPLGSEPDCQSDGIPDSCQLYTIPRAGGTVVQDGGFETGSPNPYWTETSDNFGTPLCTIDLCGTGLGTGPHGGDWWAWFGGIAAPESGSVEQTVTIPSGATTMEFYYENPASSGNGTDFVRATIDGNVVWSETEGNAAYATYALVSVDITTYGDGGTHTLRFESTITGSPSGTNFFIDDVEILEPTGPPPNDCNLNGVPDECDAPTCGDGCLTGGVGVDAEECDGVLDDACPGECRGDCTCPVCGDSIVDTNEDCDGGVCCTSGCAFDSGSECRPSTGACDPAEYCDGSAAGCPADVVITACVNDDGCCAPGCNNTNDTDCAAVCGNNVAEAAEACDGTDDAACPGACKSDCTCPTCGDGIVNQASEQCDGADDGACPGLCGSDCTCPGSGGIPTASVWGLIVMTLLLLAGAKVYFGRREASVM